MTKTKQRLNAAYCRKLKLSVTTAENRMREALSEDGIYFIFQKGWLKDAFFISDFYLPKLKTVIEIDGDYHNRPDQQIKDKTKDAYYIKRGFRVLRFKNSQVLTDLSLRDALRQIKNV